MNIGYDILCLNNRMNYEIGKTYTFHGSMNLNDRDEGFKFYFSPEYLFKNNKYYFTKHFSVVEFEILGEYIEFDKIFSTNKLKVIRIYSCDEFVEKFSLLPNKTILIKHDDSGNIIYRTCENGLEEWFEYDLNGNCIHKWNSKGEDRVMEYDSSGIMICLKINDGSEFHYDSKGLGIHYKYPNGYEEWYENDDNGNCIHSRTSEGFEEWHEYDENETEIYYLCSDGTEKREDSFANIIYKKNNVGYEEWFEYDSNNKMIGYRDNEGKKWNIEVE